VLEKKLLRSEQQNDDLSTQLQLVLQASQQPNLEQLNPTTNPKEPQTSPDHIKDHLVPYKNVQELQNQNRELLRNIRELAENRQNEAEMNERMKKVKKELEELKVGKEKVDIMLSQLKEENNLYKTLLKQSEDVRKSLENSINSIKTEKPLQPTQPTLTEPEILILLKHKQEEFDQFKQTSKIPRFSSI